MAVKITTSTKSSAIAQSGDSFPSRPAFWALSTSFAVAPCSRFPGDSSHLQSGLISASKGSSLRVVWDISVTGGAGGYISAPFNVGPSWPVGVGTFKLFINSGLHSSPSRIPPLTSIKFSPLSSSHVPPPLHSPFPAHAQFGPAPSRSAALR
ncbi:hypothetical protein GALMADRAFT_141568 [Galerina marginata CBS 339.88]|uniref:Uncharacterized protein n=1 Tax=Galerina marginata (strain CBS 339.88) TaxID=685588 RepID=A0A067SUJ3_GALM3|nr:hypothetical protein GALMADRAFT_141568 [Galerina marginata CBS 339.88]